MLSTLDKGFILFYFTFVFRQSVMQIPNLYTFFNITPNYTSCSLYAIYAKKKSYKGACLTVMRQTLENLSTLPC